MSAIRYWMIHTPLGMFLFLGAIGVIGLLSQDDVRETKDFDTGVVIYFNNGDNPQTLEEYLKSLESRIKTQNKKIKELGNIVTNNILLGNLTDIYLEKNTLDHE